MLYAVSDDPRCTWSGWNRSRAVAAAVCRSCCQVPVTGPVHSAEHRTAMPIIGQTTKSADSFGARSARRRRNGGTTRTTPLASLPSTRTPISTYVVE